MGKRNSANDALAKLALKHKSTYLLLQEPLRHPKVAGFTSYWVPSTDSPYPRASVLISSSVPAILRSDLSTGDLCIVETEALRVVSIYCHASSSRSTLLDIAVSACNKPCVIGLDANAHHPMWCESLSLSDAAGDEVVDFLLRSDFNLINPPDCPPTFNRYTSERVISTVIDLSISNCSITNFRILNAPESDHEILIFESSLYSASKGKRVSLESPIYAPAEFPCSSDANTCATLFDKACKTSMSLSSIRIPKCRLECKWWTAELSLLRRNLNSLRSQNRSNPEITPLFNEAFLHYKEKLKRAKTDDFNNFINNIDPRNPFKSLAFLRNSVPSSGPRTDGPTSVAAEATLKSLFPLNQPSTPLPTLPTLPNTPPPDSISLEEIKYIIYRQKVTSAGPDGTTWNLLKHNPRAQEQLHFTISLCYSEGIFPDRWKSGKVITIPKKNGSLRPLTLLPVASKVMEKCLACRLNYFIERNSIISPAQFAYRQNLGTEPAISKLKSLIERAFIRPIVLNAIRRILDGLLQIMHSTMLIIFRYTVEHTKGNGLSV